MTVSHKDLPNSELHEPKGVSAATAGTVYVANGAGTGTWSAPRYFYTLTVQMADLSTPGSVYIPVPISGTITKISSAIGAVIATADSVVTGYIGATPITNGSLTVAYSGSAIGDVDSCSPSALNAVSAGNLITLTSDGGSTNTCPTTFVVTIQVN